MTGCSGGFGSSGFGAGPFGSGTTLHVASASASATNAIDVLFTGTPEESDPATVWDALRPANWTLVAVDPYGATVRLAQFVERIDASSVRVFFDGPLDQGVTYRIVASDQIRATGGGVIAPTLDCRSAVFVSLVERHTPFLEPVMAALAGATDLANPQSGQDAPGPGAPLGTFQRTTQGDIGAESGRRYLRKRVLRRMVTGVGAFFHLPRYGLGQKLKILVRPDYGRRLAAEARAQIRSEPDVVSVTVVSREDPNYPQLVYLDAKVRDRFGLAVEVSLPVAFAG